jgi:hypothetical protein
MAMSTTRVRICRPWPRPPALHVAQHVRRRSALTSMFASAQDSRRASRGKNRLIVASPPPPVIHKLDKT